jgi:GTPase SAR1 family protein
MRQVVLTVGPQHVGKSTFCKEIIKSHPETVLVSRDAILTDLFGSPYLDGYSGGHFIALEKMWKMMARQLKRRSVVIILDCWNGPNNERCEITRKLRDLGTEIIGAWYFVTPEEACLGWYMEKVLADKHAKSPEWEKFRQETSRVSFLDHYRYFYEAARVNHRQGFDFVMKINPLEPPPFESLFRTSISESHKKVRQLS